ncbi:MAG: acyl-CoA thioesterase [Rhodobacter sp.]|nr:acyl-CoA thioesterase [Paracoccaceae bacterium]MCC0078127.1 acyl-CoA thioesterase [Rhodobacter sp.]
MTGWPEGGVATIEEIRGTAPLVIRRTVRWGDCDPAGIVYTPRFLDFAVSAYEGFLGQMLGGDLHHAKRALGVDFPVRGVELDFRAPLAVEDRFDMVLQVGEIRSRSFDLHIAARRADDGRPAFRARLSPVVVDLTSRQAVPLPSPLQHRAAAYARAHPFTTEVPA